ncbi:MAG: IPT/TIG domain-containing protein [Deltaproteobacteria bacterium]|nr:IPT/TIG domain-containing protein [Deltaproteobacteria bacterium]
MTARGYWLGAIVAVVGALAGCSPTISSLEPEYGSVGTIVTIEGSGFGATQGAATVTFDGVPAGPASSWSDSTITVAAPPGAKTGEVRIVLPSGLSSNPLPFIVSGPRVPAPRLAVMPGYGYVPGDGATVGPSAVAASALRRLDGWRARRRLPRRGSDRGLRRRRQS